MFHNCASSHVFAPLKNTIIGDNLLGNEFTLSNMINNGANNIELTF